MGSNRSQRVHHGSRVEFLTGALENAWFLTGVKELVMVMEVMNRRMSCVEV